MSPTIFNLIMDELLTHLNQHRGIIINGNNLSCLAFADDLILIAKTIDDAKILLHETIKFLNKHELQIKPKKALLYQRTRFQAKRNYFSILHQNST